ncbi:MAG: histidine kinase,HAMP proteinhistidine kinase [Armatimonadetes bacterium]|jgi:signal transduction histidine kinase|nr:histidine kinase,HAMP proteinhistidine kinase [Armatimonadota bacterium]
MSIRWKLLLLSLGPTALAAGLLMVYGLWSFQDFFLETTRSDLTARAAVLAQSVGESLGSGDAAHAAVLAERSAAGAGVRARVISLDGRLLTSSQLDLDRQLTDWKSVPGIPEALAGRTTSGIGHGLLASGERLFVALPVTRGGRIVGAARMSLSLEQYNRQLRRNLRGQLLALLAILLGCAAVCAGLARSLSEPIHDMGRFAARVGSGHFGDVLEHRRHDELGLLAAELSRMSEQLAAADNTRRALLANVTHEFLTPVTNVQVTLEALQAGAAVDPDLRDRFLQNAYDEMERLKNLLLDLLDLGRLEAGVALLRLRECSLAEVLHRSVRAVESRLRLGGVTAVVAGTDATVSVDGERLQQAILAVLDNAIKHSASGSVIELTIEPGEQWVRIRIRDQGPGIGAADLPHVFEPFFVGDESRSGRGTGLGLAIAHRITHMHGGSISAAAEAGAGAEFTLELPRHAIPSG